MGLEYDVSDTLTARQTKPHTAQTTITLANVTCQASTTTCVSADALRMINLLNAKVSTDGANLLVLAEWTQIGLLAEKSTCKYMDLLPSSP